MVRSLWSWNIPLILKKSLSGSRKLTELPSLMDQVGLQG